MPFKIRLSKENFKFSCSHFTILSPDSAEPLHGHNYYVSLEVELNEIDPQLGWGMDFNVIKPMIREILNAWDEQVLLPARSPFLKITSSADSVRAQFREKSYEFPASDVTILDAVNVTSEELARLVFSNLSAKFKADPRVNKLINHLAVEIQETRGQSVVYESEL